jgi:C4-dicarboxylate-binding protein DctP
MAMSLPSTTQAQTPIVIEFSHVVSADTAKGKAALRFKELAESRTNGKVRVEVYPDSQRYRDGEEIEALRSGAVQMLAPSFSKLSRVGGSDLMALDLPFLFKDHGAFQQFTQGDTAKGMLNKLQLFGIYGLAFWDNGIKVFSANSPLHTAQDFAGLKVRVQASKVLIKQMELLHALPSVMPLTDVGGALQKGTLDGEENVPSNILTQRLHLVQKHLTVTNHGYLAYVVIVNKRFWDKLPLKIRTTLEGALQDATTYANQLAEQENTRALEQIQASGKVVIYEPTVAERKGLQQAMDGVYGATRNMFSPEVQAAIEKLKSAPP